MGFYDSEGLDVKLIQPGEDDSTQIVASGKVDFAISGQESVTLARVKDIPIVSIAAIIQHNTSAFASLKEMNIKTVKDFEGKRYGGWGSPIEKAVIQSVMTDAGGDYGKVKFITLGATDFVNSIGRDSDVQWIFYGWEGIDAKLKGKDLNLIMLKDLNPVLDYYTPLIVTNENHVNSQKALVKKFMRATVKGYEFAVKHPDESATILLKNAPELNKELVKQSQTWISPQYTADAKSWGIQKNEVWKRYADWLFEHKQIEKNIQIEKAFTNEFLTN
jgi:ABC-type nitrate/sulfonate/bicarbonate transport system substrate-binding protein